MSATLAAVPDASLPEPPLPAFPPTPVAPAGGAGPAATPAANATATAAAVAVADEPSIGYLRGFVTLLVVAHHSLLAYVPFAPPAAPSSLLAGMRAWMAFPVIDAARWPGFGLFVSVNDTFFMSLMFFLSGLFVWPSLARRGAAAFLRGRALRLGLPFLAVAALVAPLAYYPAYLQATGGHAAGLAGYAHQWLQLGIWPAGPAWFLWVLLAFDLLAALLFARFPAWAPALGRLTAGAQSRPARFFGVLLVLSAAVYLPLALTVGPLGWTAFGPFFFQTSRILHYALYFLAGIAVGAPGLGRGLLAADGNLARRWRLWLTAAMAAICAMVAVAILAFAPHASPEAWAPVWAAIFVLSCGTCSFALLAFFSRFARRPARPLDSLRANAYGIYLLHYAFASWLQLTLLHAALHGFTKGILVTLATIALSWAATAALRQIPAIAKII